MRGGMSIGPGLGLDRLAGVAGWTPANLSSPALAWWTPRRGDLITLSGAAVTSYRDVIGGYDCVQAVSAARPVLSTFANGAPGVLFDGVDDYLEYPAVVLGWRSACEIWTVISQAALAADATVRAIVAYGGNSANNRRLLGRSVVSGVNRARASNGNGAASVDANGAVVDLSGRHVLRFVSSASDQLIETNGVVDAASAPVVPAISGTRFRLGCNAQSLTGFHQGLIGDILITPPLGNTDAANLRSYLTNY